VFGNVSPSLARALAQAPLDIPYNGLSVVLGGTQETDGRRRFATMVRLLMEEVVARARALGYGLADVDVDRISISPTG
jgi:hypothetical protein